jgi:MFS family permease
VVMGHFGDRLGRKRVMLATVVMMGIASFAIGCLPTFDQVGLLAPALLVVLRVVQGFSAGAESAGASTLTVERSPVGKRGFFTSFVMVGYAVGCSLATIVFLPVALLPAEQLYGWGWRVPFWLSAVVVVITYYVRSHLDETPVFAEAKEGSAVRKLPLSDVFKYHWRSVICVAGASLLAAMQTLFAVFSLSYATSVGIDRSVMLAVISALSIVTIPAAGYLSDVIGRKRTVLISAVGCSLTLFGYLWVPLGDLDGGRADDCGLRLPQHGPVLQLHCPIYLRMAWREASDNPALGLVLALAGQVWPGTAETAAPV